MNKIVPLRANRAVVRPVLMLLTSHRLDCLLLSLRCLERFTNLARFKKIYIVANAVSPDHAAILNRFMHTHERVEVVHCSPRGLMPAVNAVQNEILERHREDVVVKLDEDVFVTPRWLEHLLEGYRFHSFSRDVPLVSALCPVSPHGLYALGRHLKAAFPTERAMFDGGIVEENWVYHRWIWEKVVREDFVQSFLASEPQPYFYSGFASLNCVIYDARLMEAILPLPTEALPGGPVSDEQAVNMVLAANKCKTAVVSRCVAHHYSFSRCEDYLRSHVPLDMVWHHLQEVWREEQIMAKAGALRRFRPVPVREGAAASS